MNKKELKENEIRCAYCRKVIDKAAAIPRKIFYRGYSGGNKTFYYCCAEHGAYDQMSKEG